MARSVTTADDLMSSFPKSLRLNREARRTFRRWFDNQSVAGNIKVDLPKDVFAPVLGAFGSNEASRLAAVNNFMKSGSQRRRVFEIIANRGRHGATNPEIEHRKGLERPSGSNRRLDLMKAGLVRATDRTRPTRSGNPATVYILTALGREVWADMHHSVHRAS